MFNSEAPAIEEEHLTLSSLYRTIGNPVIQRYYKGGVPHNLYLSDVLRPLVCGTRAKQLKANSKHLRPEVVDIAQAFRVAGAQPLADYLNDQPQRKDYRVWLDQHITCKLVPFMQDVFGYTTHVKDEGLRNNTDRTLFEKAAENGVDIIVTQDKSMHHSRADLTAIAVTAHHNGLSSVIKQRGERKSHHASQGPLIVQIGNETNTEPEIRALFERSYHRIVDEVEKRAVPFIRILPDEVKSHTDVLNEVKSPELLAVEKRLKAMGYRPEGA